MVHRGIHRLGGVLFDIRIEDQYTVRLLRDGVVMRAVTTEHRPVPGGRIQPVSSSAVADLRDIADGGLVHSDFRSREILSAVERGPNASESAMRCGN
jgi:hypothetical protein